MGAQRRLHEIASHAYCLPTALDSMAVVEQIGLVWNPCASSVGGLDGSSRNRRNSEAPVEVSRGIVRV